MIAPWPTRRLFGLDFADLTLAEAADAVVTLALGSAPPSFVVTPNVDHLVRLEERPQLRELYARAALVLADGMPIVWASRVLGCPLRARVTGADLLPVLVARGERHDLRLFFLGGRPGAAERAAERFARLHPRLRKPDSYAPRLGFEDDATENARAVAAVQAASPHLLFVALGSPKQEQWIARHLHLLGARVALGVGGAVDFAAGMARRAPPWLQRAGLEWAYRVAREPWRLPRVVHDTRFAAIMARALADALAA